MPRQQFLPIAFILYYFTTTPHLLATFDSTRCNRSQYNITAGAFIVAQAIMATKRLVGRKKVKPPPQTLEETTKRIDERIQRVDAQVQRLNKQLRDIKVKMSTAKGPEKKRIAARAKTLLKRKLHYEKQRDNIGKWEGGYNESEI